MLQTATPTLGQPATRLSPSTTSRLLVLAHGTLGYLFFAVMTAGFMLVPCGSRRTTWSSSTGTTSATTGPASR